jgi:uncharacterized protein YegL
MKQNFTAIAVIIDASSSMSPLTGDTIGSFNTFLSEQKANPSEAAFSLCTFNDDYRLVHDFISLHSVSELNRQIYNCSGCTALLDAMGTTIDSLGAKLAAMPEEERPSKVIVLVITDGEENRSRRYTLDQIKSKVEHQRNVYSWEFVFIGANVDAISTGTSMGFAAHNSVAYAADSRGTQQLYRSVSSNLGSYRSSLAPAQVDFFGQTGVTPTSDTVASPPTTPISFDPGHSLPTKK